MAINFDDAIMAHSKWKTRLRKLADGSSNEKIDTDTLRKDNQCDLGKWIETQRTALQDDPDFKELVSAHAEFHKLAAGVADQISLGNRTEATKTLDNASSPYIQQSSLVVQLIAKLRAKSK